MSDPIPPQPPVNPQIVDAVKTATTYALGLQAPPTPPPGGDTTPSRLSACQAMAYDKAAQAAAIAFQDAADYQRNVLSVSNVAQGKALAMMFIDKPNFNTYLEIFGVALVGSIVAPIVAGMAADSLTTALSKFPKI